LSDSSTLNGVAEELSSLLLFDRRLLMVYLSFLTIPGEVNEDNFETLTGEDSRKFREVIESLVEYGLVIKGVHGFLPVHPRLAISNLYRLALSKDDGVRRGRTRVDAITAGLVKRREELREWR
jgi:hypothetical protein